MNLEKKIKTPPTGKKINGSMFTCINLRERERESKPFTTEILFQNEMAMKWLSLNE